MDTGLFVCKQVYSQLDKSETVQHCFLLKEPTSSRSTNSKYKCALDYFYLIIFIFFRQIYALFLLVYRKLG